MSKSKDSLAQHAGPKSTNKTERDTKFSGMGMISNKSFVLNNHTIDTAEAQNTQKLQYS
jgi:hypothetical protein